MVLGDRIKQLRVAKNLSQVDVENRTGLLCCYTSRVENGYTTPTLETLEKYARAFEVPVYQFFVNGSEKRLDGDIVAFVKQNSIVRTLKGDREIERFRPLLSRMSVSDRLVLLHVANKMARSKPSA